MQLLLAAVRRRRGNDAAMVWVVIAIALATMAVVATIALISKRNRRKRAEAMERVAGELGLEYRAVGSDGLVEQLSGFELFSKGRGKKVVNMLQGGSGDRRLAIFDYQYTTGGGKHTQTYRTTVLSLRSDGSEWPSFILRRKQPGDAIASWFRGRGIEFAGRPTFSKRYLLRGEDEPAIRTVFTEPVVDYFEENPGLFVEAAGNEVLVYRLGQKVRPEGVSEFLGKGFEVLGLMRQT
jgi:hypothetical protein